LMLRRLQCVLISLSIWLLCFRFPHMLVSYNLLATRNSIGYIQTPEKEYYCSDDQADGDYVERRDAIYRHCWRFPASWSRNLGFKLCCNYKISLFPGDGIRGLSLSRILC
jgi:hypothetical protein